MATLIKFDEEEPIGRGGGIETVRLSAAPLPEQRFTMGITSFPPGTSIPLHSHNTIEQVTVIEGEGEAELNGERMPARPYDTTQIAPGEMHRFLNTGSAIMRILWVYGSTHVTRTFAETGETVDQFAQGPGQAS
ncbi:MAG: cupin domain-containing protein [Nitriliruptorales bacterium]|nr:cupin domain-containing protein [Nitriliruptorales bacterium]